MARIVHTAVAVGARARRGGRNPAGLAGGDPVQQPDSQSGGRLCPARTSSGTAPVMRDPVTRHVECPAMLAAGGNAALLRLRYCVFSEASTSMTSWIFSPTTTPPVGSAMLAVMPQSVRLISPMADRPDRVPP